MTNHFHLLLQLQRPADLSSWRAGMLRAYVHFFNRRYGFSGHLWQGRFKSPAIQYLLSCGRYIERNPLEVGIVIEPWQYAWSSCRAYACGTADSLLAENRYYLELAADDSSRQRYSESHRTGIVMGITQDRNHTGQALLWDRTRHAL